MSASQIRPLIGSRRPFLNLYHMSLLSLYVYQLSRPLLLHLIEREPEVAP